MDMELLLSNRWSAMLPEFIILGTVVMMSILDFLLPKRMKRRPLAWLGLTGIILAFISLLGLLQTDTISILFDSFRLDSFAKAFKLLLLIGSALIILLADSYIAKDGVEVYRGEFYSFFLTALLGAMIMTSSGDLMTLFVGLELFSVPSYILAGIRKKDPISNEATLKYIMNGGVSTALILFGMSYLYGLTGSTNLKEMNEALQLITDNQMLYLLGLAFFIVFVGLSFKIVSAPFHMWAPDVFQGATPPVAAFLSVLSKIVGFVIILRIFLSLSLVLRGDAIGAFTFFEKNSMYVAVLAGITMIIGNVGAIRQLNIKRLFAYSSIAHTGYLLVPFTTLGAEYFLFDTFWFYLLAYLLMNLGAFAVIQIVCGQSRTEDISEFTGLYKQSPLLALAMTVFILSLMGIPGTSGFIGKLHIFLGTFASEPGHYILASVIMVTTVLSYIYCFGILTQIFFRTGNGEKKYRVSYGLAIVLSICALGTLLFGLVPNLALDFFHTNFGNFTDFLY